MSLWKDSVIKEIERERLEKIEKIDKYESLVDAFEDSETFILRYVDYSGVVIRPKDKAITQKQLAIDLDEILFGFDFEIDREDTTSNGLLIYLGHYCTSFCIEVFLKESLNCKMVLIEKRLKYTSYEVRAYRIACEGP